MKIICCLISIAVGTSVPNTNIDSSYDWYTYFEELDFKFKSYEHITFQQIIQVSIFNNARDNAAFALREWSGRSHANVEVLKLIQENPANAGLFRAIREIEIDLLEMKTFNQTQFLANIEKLGIGNGGFMFQVSLAHLTAITDLWAARCSEKLKNMLNDRQLIRDQIIGNLSSIELFFATRIGGLHGSKTAKERKLQMLERLKNRIVSAHPALEQLIDSFDNKKSSSKNLIISREIRNAITRELRTILFRRSTIDSISSQDLASLINTIAKEYKITREGYKSIAIQALNIIADMFKTLQGDIARLKIKIGEEIKTIQEFNDSLTQLLTYRSI